MRTIDSKTKGGTFDSTRFVGFDRRNNSLPVNSLRRPLATNDDVADTAAEGIDAFAVEEVVVVVVDDDVDADCDAALIFVSSSSK
jgi:hypothetical protein